LAQYLFDDERSLIRIDMSEYQEKHTVSRLVGAPPGYVGYEEGGQLTEAVRRRPYCVILLDEIEKAHSDVFHVLLQVLDDGRLTDGQGRTVDFKNTIVIMTSNAQRDDLPRLFRPEFLNRVDEIITFDRLTQEDLKKIVDIQLEVLRARLAERHIDLTLTDRAKEHLIQVGYDAAYGARPLKRAIQKEVETPLARMLVAGEVRDGKRVRLDLDAGSLVFAVESPQAVSAS
jgi:ATP-dependent Clp protease ATP-binding subunit ClpB